MSKSAYIKLVEGSEQSTITLDDVKQLLHTYKEQTAKTGEQLNWAYSEAALPYTIEPATDGDERWLYLKANDPLYKFIIFGVGSEQADDQEVAYIQIVLPEGCTHGDKAKANELGKHFAKKLKAELHLFNERVMYFNPRK